MNIRSELPGDEIRIRVVNETAFASAIEATLVEVVRRQCEGLISLVSEEQDSDIIGHILFSPVVHSGPRDVRIMGLGPMAVMPMKQRRGVGSALVRAGLERCKESGVSAIVVVGHPAYYPRFGFVPASRFGLRCEFEVPDEVFMAMELRPGALRNVQGLIQYHPAFSAT